MAYTNSETTKRRTERETQADSETRQPEGGERGRVGVWVGGGGQTERRHRELR